MLNFQVTLTLTGPWPPPMASGGFLDPKARGMNLGYDQAVALPAMQADGKSGQEDIFKETNKVFDVTTTMLHINIMLQI